MIRYSPIYTIPRLWIYPLLLRYIAYNVSEKRRDYHMKIKISIFLSDTEM